MLYWNLLYLPCFVLLTRPLSCFTRRLLFVFPFCSHLDHVRASGKEEDLAILFIRKVEPVRDCLYVCNFILRRVHGVGFYHTST